MLVEVCSPDPSALEYKYLLALVCLSCVVMHSSVMLAEQSELELVEVEYISLPGWKSTIASLTSYDDLPANAKAYINKLEELIGIPSKFKEMGMQS